MRASCAPCSGTAHGAGYVWAAALLRLGGPVSIEERITAALDGRAAQRPFANDLAGNWDKLTNSFTSLASSAADLAHAARAAAPSDVRHAEIFTDLEGYLAGRADWQQRAAELTRRLKECAGRVRVLHKRVNRQTVNIGVIGVTGAGKSTLLRKLSGLPQEYIPSNRFASSTATPSKIFHESGSGQGRAVLYLHTWESFRDEVLRPLHKKVGESVPSTLDEFQRFRYRDGAVPEGEAGAERYLKRLRAAQESLPSYATHLRGGKEQITLDKLRPFVAYPSEENSRDRPYHAVRSVDIFCEFPEVGAVRLGLVDLPGSGEAGLDVHGRFLADLRNDTDLLFIVKRPTQARGSEQDWDVAQLADDAAAGVRRDDFAHMIINRDTSLPTEYFDWDSERTVADASKLGVDVRTCDIERTPGDEVTRAILAPILDHLARRLRDMDRDAIAFVLGELTDLAAQVRSLANELVQQVGTWQRSLPDDEKQHRIRVLELKNQLSWELGQVVNAYDELHRSGAPITELHQEIERAGRAVRQWQASGLGYRSTEDWLDTFEKAIVGGAVGHELDRRFNEARKKAVEEFSRIDTSLKLAIERLWGEVGTTLRNRLTDKIVPPGPNSAAALSEFADLAEMGGAKTVSDATKRLLALQADYGSIFLRVGRPVVRRIKWYDDKDAATSAQAPGQPAPVTNLDDQADDVPWYAEPETIQAAASVAQAVTGLPVSGLAGNSGAPPADDPAAKKYPEGARWHRRLSETVEKVTSELEREFHSEAQRTLQVLAAAVDLFKDSATTEPEIEVEYERLCKPVQREIWPSEFSDAAANVTAEMAALRQQAVDAETVVGTVLALANQAHQLQPLH